MYRLGPFVSLPALCLVFLQQSNGLGRLIHEQGPCTSIDCFEEVDHKPTALVIHKLTHALLSKCLACPSNGTRTQRCFGPDYLLARSDHDFWEFPPPQTEEEARVDELRGECLIRL